MPVCSPGTEQACPLGLAASHHATIGGVRGENRRIGYRRGQSTKLKKGYIQASVYIEFVVSVGQGRVGGKIYTPTCQGTGPPPFTIRSKRVFTPVLCPVKIELFLF